MSSTTTTSHHILATHTTPHHTTPHHTTPHHTTPQHPITNHITPPPKPLTSESRLTHLLNALAALLKCLQGRQAHPKVNQRPVCSGLMSRHASKWGSDSSNCVCVCACVCVFVCLYLRLCVCVRLCSFCGL